MALRKLTWYTGFVIWQWCDHFLGVYWYHYKPLSLCIMVRWWCLWLHWCQQLQLWWQIQMSKIKLSFQCWLCHCQLVGIYKTDKCT